jgi:uncharacterized membrane protein
MKSAGLYLMDIFTIALLFAVGSVAGWIFEVVGRLFTQEKRLVNPGFLSGPYLPIHGFGLLLFYLFASLNLNFASKALLFLCSATALELVTGLAIIYYYHIRLWDYSDNFLNFKGIICPLYSLLWLTFGIGFYVFVYPLIPKVAGYVLSYDHSLFFLGFFYGMILLDGIKSFMIAQKIRRFFADINLKNIVATKLDYDSFREKVAARMKKQHKENFLSRYLLSFKSMTDKNLTSQLRSFLIVKRKALRADMTRRQKRIKRHIIKSSEGILKGR